MWGPCRSVPGSPLREPGDGKAYERDRGIGRDETVLLTRESAVLLVRGLPGFLDYELVEAGDTFLAISHWRTREEATAVTVAHQEWQRAQAPALPWPVEVSVGEVVIPRQEA